MCTVARMLEIVSALSGAGGTAFLYKGTFGFESLSPYSSSKIVEGVATRNQRRLRMQRLGLGLLMLSFLCSLAHVFIE